MADPPPERSCPEPSLALKLFSDAQASISVPSTEKCSDEINLVTRGCARTAARKLRGYGSVEQTVAVLRKHRCIPYRIIDAEPDEPTKQKIELQALRQLAFRAGTASV